MHDALYQAYRSTDYAVQAPTAFTLLIGETSAPCDALLAAHGVKGAAFLTAWNPFSQSMADADNAVAQARLAADLEIVSTAIFSGHGKGKNGDWSPEPGPLALGISEAEATQLAKTYRQNAYVRVSRGQPARLVICV